MAVDVGRLAAFIWFVDRGWHGVEIGEADLVMTAGKHPLLCESISAARVGGVVAVHPHQPDQATPGTGVDAFVFGVVAHQRDCVREPVPGLTLGPIDDLSDFGTDDVVGVGPPVGLSVSAAVEVDPKRGMVVLLRRVSFVDRNNGEARIAGSTGNPEGQQRALVRSDRAPASDNGHHLRRNYFASVGVEHLDRVSVRLGELPDKERPAWGILHPVPAQTLQFRLGDYVEDRDMVLGGLDDSTGTGHREPDQETPTLDYRHAIAADADRADQGLEVRRAAHGLTLRARHLAMLESTTHITGCGSACGDRTPGCAR